MTQQIVQLVDKDGNDIFPVSAGNGEVKIGETLSQPTSVEYVDTDNIVDGAVTENKLDFSTLDFGNYSTTEQDTGFTWVDGRHIYKKTIYCGKGPNANQKDTSTGVANLDFVTRIEGVAYTAATSLYMGPSYLAIFTGGTTEVGAGTIALGYVKSSNVVRITANGDRAAYDFYVTIWYVKTS